MNKTICTLAVAVASCVAFGSSAQAQSRSGDVEVLLERDMTMPPAQGPIVREQPRVRVYSGETLSGRRELKSDNGIIVQDGNEEHAIFRKGGNLEREKVRGFLGEGDVDRGEMEVEIDD